MLPRVILEGVKGKSIGFNNSDPLGGFLELSSVKRWTLIHKIDILMFTY